MMHVKSTTYIKADSEVEMVMGMSTVCSPDLTKRKMIAIIEHK